MTSIMPAKVDTDALKALRVVYQLQLASDKNVFEDHVTRLHELVSMILDYKDIRHECTTCKEVLLEQGIVPEFFESQFYCEDANETWDFAVSKTRPLKMTKARLCCSCDCCEEEILPEKEIDIPAHHQRDCLYDILGTITGESTDLKQRVVQSENALDFVVDNINNEFVCKQCESDCPLDICKTKCELSLGCSWCGRNWTLGKDSKDSLTEQWCIKKNTYISSKEANWNGPTSPYHMRLFEERLNNL